MLFDMSRVVEFNFNNQSGTAEVYGFCLLFLEIEVFFYMENYIAVHELNESVN